MFLKLLIIDLAISGNPKVPLEYNAMFPENSQIVFMTDFKCKAHSL